MTLKHKVKKNIKRFATFFYPKIRDQGHASVKRWSSGVSAGAVELPNPSMQRPTRTTRTKRRGSMRSLTLSILLIGLVGASGPGVVAAAADTAVDDSAKSLHYS